MVFMVLHADAYGFRLLTCSTSPIFQSLDKGFVIAFINPIVGMVFRQLYTEIAWFRALTSPKAR